MFLLPPLPLWQRLRCVWRLTLQVQTVLVLHLLVVRRLCRLLQLLLLARALLLLRVQVLHLLSIHEFLIDVRVCFSEVFPAAAQPFPKCGIVDLLQ